MLQFMMHGFLAKKALYIFYATVFYLFTMGLPLAHGYTLGEPPVFPEHGVPFDLGAPFDLVEEPVPQTQGLSVSPQSRDESRNFYNTYYAVNEPAINWSGNHQSCSSGTTAQDFRDAIAQRINYFRAMAGIPATITLSDTYSAKAQEAALMMSVNNTLNHTPPSTWTCYTTTGAEAAGSSNLALGINSVSAISGYMKDYGSGNYPVGHRRWILYPQTQVMGTGDIPNAGSYTKANALWVFDSNRKGARPTTSEEFVAWPPKGYVPYQVVFPRWSFAYAKADFSSATVSMTSDNTNVAVTLSPVVNGYGENTLVWIPMNLSDSATWPKPSGDTTYKVTVANVVINGVGRTFEYNVTVFDPSVSLPTPTPTPTPTPGTKHVTHDFDGDDKSDLLWRNTRTGDVVIWLMNAQAIAGGGFVVKGLPVEWDIKAAGDFNGDGKSDILLQNSVTDDVYIWLMDGAKITGGDYLQRGLPGEWEFKATGDFNGDGRSDIMWQNTTTGDVVVWLMAGTKINAGGLVVKGLPRDWIVKAAADFDNDGKSDVLLQNSGGDVVVWLMDGASVSEGGYVSSGIPGNWQIKAVGDLDGDGKTDVLWQDSATGDVAAWLINGSTVIGGNYVVRGVPNNWKLLVVGDYSGDGKADVLWQDSVTGDVAVWFMDGIKIVGGGFATKALEPDWRTK
ncbi:SCP-like extracellular domain protein [Candidatus Magnetobacterium bavaricum]|uniref:SCP-like extracellular domain protein n=1 Tax=Candidatus Magnetobacterium bavaricum TaxID=29290 RepID=A0A0F3H0V5_9BACT|nr:SCP-like extracellular domain protein [Candidatus Magnetobacterium bavaricum]